MPRTERWTWGLALGLLLWAGGATACRTAQPVAAGPDSVTAAVVSQLFRPCPKCAGDPAFAVLERAGFETLESAHVVAAYLPDSDRAGKAFDVEPWETEALTLLGHLFGGATSWPSRGSYRESDADGQAGKERIILEHTHVVVSFASQRDFSPAALAELAAFMDRFRVATDQDSVAMVIDGRMFLR